MSKGDISAIILHFLNEENRPFSASDLYERCGKDFGRGAVQKALDTLKAKDKIVCKSFGKQIIYHAKQSNDLTEIKKKLQIRTQQLAQAQHNVKNKQAQLRELEMKLKSLSNLKSVGDLEEERENIAKEICEFNEKLQRFTANAKSVKFTPATVKKIETQYENAVDAYRKRKRICVDMLDAIQEGTSKPRKKLIEDIGLETDESVGYKFETI